jgi:cobalamin biosynthesis protein CobT
LVDLSGSMRGEKIEETFKGVVLFAEALERVKSVLGNLKVAIYGFQDDLLKYKEFNEELSEKIRKEMNLMKREVEDKGKHNRAAYNNDGYCLDKISKILDKEEGEDKFLFVLSDGIPEGDVEHHISGYSKKTEDEELLAVVENISKNTEIKLLGIGLGPGTEHVEKFYSKEFRNVDNMPNVKVEDLAKQLALKLEELIK